MGIEGLECGSGTTGFPGLVLKFTRRMKTIETKYIGLFQRIFSKVWDLYFVL